MRLTSPLAATAAALAIAGVVPATAEAKLCVRLAAPFMAARGQPVQISATTLMPTAWEAGRPVGLRPVAGSVRLRLALLGPGGEWKEVALRRLPTRPAVSRATVRFPAAGTWRLSLLGWEYAPRACAPPAIVRVVDT